MNSIMGKVFGIMDFFFGSTKWWTSLKNVILSAVIAVEAAHEISVGDKAKKKAEALDFIRQQLEELGIKIPKWVFTLVVPTAINLLVTYLNNRFGKDWLKVFGDDDAIAVADKSPELWAD